MTKRLTDTQIEHWRILQEEMSADIEWIEQRGRLDARRKVVQKEILALLERFLSGQIDVGTLRETYDRKTRTDWDVFGLKGMSGAMFLNKLVKHIPDQQALTAQLKAVLSVPGNAAEGHTAMSRFLSFLEDTIHSTLTTKGQLQPARTNFFVSTWWHLQDLEDWPIFYISGRRALEVAELYKPSHDPVADYFVFRECFIALSQALDMTSWDLEHLLAWQYESKAKPPVPPLDTGKKIPDKTPEVDEEEPQVETDVGHTHIQMLLAQIGKKLGCRIWIAANDRNKVWQGTRLGDLSIDALPSLGLDAESQKIVSLIDVLWITGKKQIVAAFEVEYTTSVYSGLLRMSDLAALSPNLNFPLYIVVPENRMDKVRRELSRPTFQALELHRRCGFFPFERLIKEADAIMQWAGSPSAIEKLVERVDDVSY